MTTGGNWEIEDASLYNGVWLYALMGYADTRDEFSELFRTPEIYYYYAQYFLNLMAPKGMVADFGDANWNSNWRHFLVFFEAAARQYGDPQLKRLGATHRVDLRRAKGPPASSWSTFAYSNSVSISSSPILACSRRWSSSRASGARLFSPASGHAIARPAPP